MLDSPPVWLLIIIMKTFTIGSLHLASTRNCCVCKPGPGAAPRCASSYVSMLMIPRRVELPAAILKHGWFVKRPTLVNVQPSNDFEDQLAEVLRKDLCDTLAGKHVPPQGQQGL